MKNSSLLAFIIAILSSSISYALLIITKNYLGEDVKNSDLLYSTISFSIVIFFFLVILIKRFGWHLARKIYNDEINEELSKKLKDKNNIINIHPNMDACIDEICNKLSTEKNISIFVQIGREILSGKGIFYDYLKKNPSPESIRILHSSVRTSYLSSKEAETRTKGKLDEWRVDLLSSGQFSKQLSNMFEEGVFESRSHHEGYYWRIFQFPEVSYIQPYIYKSDNADKAPVFEIKNNDSSIYKTFNTYFNNKWTEYEPNTYYLNDFLKEASPVSVTALLKYDSLYIFSVPERYISKKKMFIQAVGGKTEKDETYKTALIREVGEEIDANIKIYNSSHTTYIHEGAVQLSEPFHDTPAPFIIYRREVFEDTRDKSVNWVLLFQAELLINSIEDLEPKNENEAIICLTREMLEKLSNPRKTLKLRDILAANDGSRIISNNNYSPELTIHPRGMVSTISASSFPISLSDLK